MGTNVTEQVTDGLVSHLEELRNRVVYAAVAVIVGMIIGWVLYPQAYHLIAGPVMTIVQERHGQVFTLQPSEAFFTRCKLSIALGVLLASPVILWQLWAFIRPGLHPHERRAIAPFMPAICLLFLAGAALAYAMLPNVTRFLLGYVPHGVNPNMDFQSSINYPLKLMIAFGLAFQLPIVLLGLIALGILTPQVLLRQWRAALVIIAAIAAVVTPTGDALNMSLLLVPLFLLYLGTVLMAFWMHRPRQDPPRNKR